MATAARQRSALRIYLEMIKFEHSIFALPFAMIGMMWGAASRSRGASAWPGWWVFVWIVVAMVSCRSAAMAFNRIVDREMDGRNPRTSARALPAGVLKLGQVNMFFVASCGLFILAAAMLNPLALALSPVALAVTLGYSLTKRFTPLTHLVLGLSLGIAPAAAWIGATGHLAWPILPVTLAVAFWTAGFDVIYAMQDDEFDGSNGLRSLPETVGRPRALAASRLMHALAIVGLLAAGILVGVGALYYVGVALAAVLLAYEQSLVSPRDLSRVNLAFFTLNGLVSIGVFLFALADAIARG